MRIGVLAQRGNWHTSDLCRASNGRHEIIECRYQDLSACMAGNRRTEFRSNARSIDDLDALLIRPMPWGSLEQVIFRMDVLAQFESQHDVRVVNAPKAIEACVDKYLSLEMLRRGGINVPKTFVSQTADVALQHFEMLDRASVIKPVFGSGGKGIFLLDDATTARTIFQEFERDGRVIYQQQYIEHGSFDIRVLVVGSHVAGMKRRLDGHWITNVQQGATVEPHIVTPFEREAAGLACRLLGADIGGIDILYDENQRPYVVEVNACPSWKAISNVVEFDVAAQIIDLLESGNQDVPIYD